MRAVLISLGVMLILLLCDPETQSRIFLTPVTQEADRIAQFEKRPELGTDILNVSSFKIASRKTHYHLGEMIDVNLAILNTSDRTLYFRRLYNAEVYSSSGTDKKKKTLEYIMKEVMPTPETYTLLDQHKMFSASYQLLAGCDQRAFQHARAQLAAKESRVIFEKELFLSWGNSCLPVTRPGVYSLTFVVSNWFVVVPSSGVAVQTGVGTLESNPLTITITK
jgi:hypothetical protein